VEDLGSESDMSFIVSTVLGNHGGGAGGGVRYRGWLVGVKSVQCDLAYAGCRGGDQVCCQSGVVPWEASSCVAVCSWQWGQGGVQRVSGQVPEGNWRMSFFQSGLGSRVTGVVKNCLVVVVVSVESDLGMECSLPGVDKAGDMSCGIIVERTWGLSNWANISSSSAHCSSTYVSNDLVSCVSWSRFGVNGAVKVVLGGGSDWVVVVGWSGEGVSGAGACNHAIS